MGEIALALEAIKNLIWSINLQVDFYYLVPVLLHSEFHYSFSHLYVQLICPLPLLVPR